MSVSLADSRAGVARTAPACLRLPPWPPLLPHRSCAWPSGLRSPRSESRGSPYPGRPAAPPPPRRPGPATGSRPRRATSAAGSKVADTSPRVDTQRWARAVSRTDTQRGASSSERPRILPPSRKIAVSVAFSVRSTVACITLRSSAARCAIDRAAHVHGGAVVVEQRGELEVRDHLLGAATGGQQGEDLPPGQLQRHQGDRRQGGVAHHRRLPGIAQQLGRRRRQVHVAQLGQLHQQARPHPAGHVFVHHRHRDHRRPRR